MRRVCAVLLSLLALSSTFASGQGPNLPLTVASWQPSCPSEPTPAGSPILAAILLPKLIEAVVDNAGAALKAAAATQSKATEAAPALGYFYNITPTGDLAKASSIGCLIVIRALYGNLKDGDITVGIDQTMFRMEAKLERIPGLRYFKLKPVYLQTGKFELSSFWNSRRDLSVSVSLKSLGAAEPFASASFQWQGLSENTTFPAGDLRLSAAATAPLPYPADAADANAAKARQAGHVAPFILAMDVLDKSAPKKDVPIPRPADLDDQPAKAALKAYCTELDKANATLAEGARTLDRRCFVDLNASETNLFLALDRAYIRTDSVNWAKERCPTYDPQVSDSECKLPYAPGLNASKEFAPFLTKVVFTESRPASKFGTFLADVLTSSSDDIKKELKEKLIPAEKKKIEEEHEQDARAKRHDVLLADLDVAAAEAELSSAEGDTAVRKAQIELAKKKIAANAAYRKVGREVPYPEFD
jgi:hypothetical protein